MSKIKQVIKQLSFFSFAYSYYRKMRRFIRGEAIILLYHRVAEVTHDPLMLAVSPENFKKHINYFSTHYTLVPLQELVKKIQVNESIRNMVAITFDDGYADNFDIALPILKQYNAPATFFITSGKIDSNEPYYWDVTTDGHSQGLPASSEQLIQASKSPLVEIGAHTVSHPHLSHISDKDQKEEIEQSKAMLAKLLNKEIVGFAYPFGTTEDFTQTTETLVKESGYMYACANTQGYVHPKQPLYKLNRVIVRDWSSDELKRHI